jgi:hypothetical protein
MTNIEQELTKIEIQEYLKETSKKIATEIKKGFPNVENVIVRIDIHVDVPGGNRK